MHADEAEIDEATVRRLLSAQFPAWAELPVRRFDSGGTTNAIFRLGDRFSARLPLTADGVEGIHREARSSRVLADATPVALPYVEALGTPGAGYPWDWAVHRWIDGEAMVEDDLVDPDRVARELAAFVHSLREVDVADAPSAHRGGLLVEHDAETRDAIAALARTDEPFDPDAAIAAWDAALVVPPSTTRTWVHSDLMPSNMLVRDNGLAAVIDLSTAGLGDPAVDLIPAWNLLPASGRRVFRDAVGADDDAWARGRGWALSMALIQLPYYRDTAPVITANARFVLDQLLS